MLWPFIHCPAGDAPSRDCAVRAPSLDAARARLAGALGVPAWTLRPLDPGPTPPAEAPAGWRVTHYPAGDAPSREYAVRAPSLTAAKRSLAAALNVPVWTLR